MRSGTDAGGRGKSAMLRSRRVVMVRATEPSVRAVLVTETVLVMEPVSGIEQLRRETVGANLKGKRPLGRRHKAHGNKRPQHKGHQDKADHPFATGITA
ncbi:MAG: hypothetical protein ACRETP_15215 [Steroidobacteraceae bacterium]